MVKTQTALDVTLLSKIQVVQSSLHAVVRKLFADLFLMYQKIVAQPKPVATLRCESGFGREDRKSPVQRPSCQVIS